MVLWLRFFIELLRLFKIEEFEFLDRSKMACFFRGLPFGVKLLGAFRRSVKTGISRILTGRCTRGQGRDKKSARKWQFRVEEVFLRFGMFLVVEQG